VTWDLAASGRVAAAARIAGQYAAAHASLSARDVAAVLGLALIAFAVYVASCIPWPYGPCLACRGNRGRSPGSNSRRHGRCRVCKGTGERLRAGTRLLPAWTNGRVPKGVRR
jgi:hypothetical protein